MLPLQRDLSGRIMPIRNPSIRRVCSPEELLFFFGHCFSPKERKIKMILLAQLGCECRIAEACAINLKDFHKNTNFRELDMLIQKKVKTITTPDGIKKRVGQNVIETKVLPEAIAAHIRAWISDNYEWILEHEGYIFPSSKMQHNSLHTPPSVIERWFGKKRQQLARLFPEMNFDQAIGQVVYKTIDKVMSKNSLVENRYLWSTHLMKRFAGTYTYLLTKDLIFTQKLLGHEKADTTQKHYIDGATIMTDRAKVKNKLFDIAFYKGISGNNKVPAVWESEIIPESRQK